MMYVLTKQAETTPSSLMDIERVDELSSQYKIPNEDVTLIALNAAGLSTDLPYKMRVRFKFSATGNAEDVFYLGIPILQKGTPFFLSAKKRELLLYGRHIGTIINAEQEARRMTFPTIEHKSEHCAAYR